MEAGREGELVLEGVAGLEAPLVDRRRQLLRQLVPELTPDTILPNCSVTTVALPAGTLVWQLEGLGETAFERDVRG